METASGIATIVCLLLALPLLIQILPGALSCMTRSKEIINFERSLSLARSRDALALLLLFPFCYFCARYRVVPCRLVAGAEGFLPALGWTLAYVGGYVVLRELCTLFFGPREGDDRILQASRRGPVTLFIPLVVLMLLTVALTFPFAAVQPYVKWSLQGEILFFYAMAYLRRGQVFSSFNPFFRTRWYLLMTEFLPSAALAAACVWLP